MRRLLAFATILTALAACVGMRAGDPAAGRRVAGEWCSECHRVAPDQPTGARPGHVLPPSLTAPSFMEIAAKPGVDAPALERFMKELHLPMPTFRLDDAERRDVAAYIVSLRR